jgi:transposase
MPMCLAPNSVQLNSQFFLLWKYSHNKKGWLFGDTPAGAHSSAVIYSLMQTAKAKGKEPYAWLCSVLHDFPAAKPVEDAEALLAWNFHSLDLTSEATS